MSTVLGTMTTFAGTFVAAKCSARHAALVAESSPPTMTSPSSFSARTSSRRPRSASACAGGTDRCRGGGTRSVHERLQGLGGDLRPALAHALRASEETDERGLAFAREPARQAVEHAGGRQAAGGGAAAEEQTEARGAAGPGTPRTGLERVSGEGAGEASVTLKVGVDAVLGNTSGSARRIKRPPRSPTSSDARRACSANVGTGSSAATSPRRARPLEREPQLVPGQTNTAPERVRTPSAARRERREILHGLRGGQTGRFGASTRASRGRASGGARW